MRTMVLMLYLPLLPLAGRIHMAHKAGQSVRAFKQEIPTATAMVTPNCV